MSGDRLVALVAIVAMLVLVVPNAAWRGLPASRMIRLALIWAVIFLAITALILVLQRSA